MTNNGSNENRSIFPNGQNAKRQDWRDINFGGWTTNTRRTEAADNPVPFSDRELARLGFYEWLVRTGRIER